MERLGSLMKKMVLVTLLLITSVLFANDTTQSLLDGDLYKNRNYTELKKVVENNDSMENLIINGWHYVLINDNGIGFGDYIRKSLFYKGGKFALISFFVDSKWNMKVLDAIYLPASQIPFRMVKGKKVYKEKTWTDVYSFCGYENKNEDNAGWFDSSSSGKIIAIATPEIFDEDNLMKKIKKAWFVDEKSGQIKEIPVDGIACLYVYGD
jgi:hypothetical protein